MIWARAKRPDQGVYHLIGLPEVNKDNLWCWSLTVFVNMGCFVRSVFAAPYRNRRISLRVLNGPIGKPIASELAYPPGNHKIRVAIYGPTSLLPRILSAMGKGGTLCQPTRRVARS